MHHAWTCSRLCSRGHHRDGGAQGRTPPLPPLWSFHILYCSSPWSKVGPWNVMSFQWRSCYSWRNALGGKDGSWQGLDISYRWMFSAQLWKVMVIRDSHEVKNRINLSLFFKQLVKRKSSFNPCRFLQLQMKNKSQKIIKARFTLKLQQRSNAF